ncbi:pilin [Acinetobacter sp. A3]|uniref:pilin n=1 Tax=Acinetobacter sp. A3 TaxID=2725492 RepID=UPI001447E7DC|nr:pilin [Acinetobacter sp. A3]
MIVVAIIGILAAIAIPAYTDYTVRAKVTEAVTTASAMKATVAENIMNAGGAAIPASGNCAGVITFASGSASSTPNVDSAACADATGIITVTTTAAAKSVPVVLEPTYTGDNVTWTCSATGFEKYVPSECR